MFTYLQRLLASGQADVPEQIPHRHPDPDPRVDLLTAVDRTSGPWTEVRGQGSEVRGQTQRSETEVRGQPGQHFISTTSSLWDGGETVDLMETWRSPKDSDSSKKTEA